MDALTFLRVRKKICNGFHCNGCPIWVACDSGDSAFEIPDEDIVSAIAYAEQWLAEHGEPAVEQPMSAVEFLEAFSRMDGRVLHFVRGCVACGEFDIAVSAAQKWAKEHPERSEG